MTFDKPTTVEELNLVLNKIVDYYIRRNDVYEEPEFEVMQLEKVPFISKTDAELEQEAKESYNGYFTQKATERTAYLTEKLAEKKLEKAKLISANQLSKAKILADYDKKIKTATSSSAKLGVYYSSIPAEIVKEYEQEKEKNLKTLEQSLNEVVNAIDVQIADLQKNIANVNNYFVNEYTYTINKKVKELKAEQEKNQKQIIEYNNTVDEHNVKYANTMLKEKKELHLHFMEIQNIQLTDDQKVSRGYFNDIFTAIEGFYEGKDAQYIYNDFKQRPIFSVLLGSFYQNYLYLLLTRATQ